MSKSVGDLLRKWHERGVFRGYAPLGEVIVQYEVLPLIAAVLDAADAMEEQHPHAQRPFDHDVFGVAAYRIARAALAEALKEGR